MLLSKQKKEKTTKKNLKIAQNQKNDGKPIASIKKYNDCAPFRTSMTAYTLRDEDPLHLQKPSPFLSFLSTDHAPSAVPSGCCGFMFL